MAYIIEEVTPEIQEKILKDASYDQKRVNSLMARGGYFNNAFQLTWAIDKTKDSYIFLAMTLPMTTNSRYYFYFKSHMYILTIDSLVTDNKFLSVGHFDEEVDEIIKTDLEEEIRQAYLAYGPSGKGKKYREPLDLKIIYKEGK